MSSLSRRALLRHALALSPGLLAGALLPACAPALPPAVPSPIPAAPEAPAPTVTPLPSAPAARPQIIRLYPDVPSAVVRARHAGVWAGETLVPTAIRQMLDASITALTGLSDARAAWAALFRPHERIAIKVSCINTSGYWTNVPLTMGVCECLQDAGIPAENILIYDRTSSELEGAGYTIRTEGPGVRCEGTDNRATGGWTVAGKPVRVSDLLLSCDALIDMPLLKRHAMSGFSFALKNHFGTVDNPDRFHGYLALAWGELNALPPIKERTRLVVGDCLTVVNTNDWFVAARGDSILMSYDPVAHDAMGLPILLKAMEDAGLNPGPAEKRSLECLGLAAKAGIGTADPEQIRFVEADAG